MNITFEEASRSKSGLVTMSKMNVSFLFTMMFVESILMVEHRLFPGREEPAVLAVTIFVTRWQTSANMAECWVHLIQKGVGGGENEGYRQRDGKIQVFRIHKIKML